MEMRYSEITISYSNKISPEERTKISCSKDVENYFRGVWKDIEYRESFYALYLNRANTVLGYFLVSLGGVSGTVCDVKIIFQAALKANASCIVILHNHPSGNLKPSEADKSITKKVLDAGKLLDITLLDHLVITSNSYFSFADEGVL